MENTSSLHLTPPSNSPSPYYYPERVIYSNPPVSTTTDNSSYYNEIQMDDGKWTRDQTQILIDTWKEHKNTLLNSAASSADHFKVWKLIANEVNKLSPPKSLQQCKKKFRNIRYICKTAMNNNKQAGSKKHFPMFYTDFVEIIAETERLKDTLRGDLPSVEIIRDGSADSMEYPSIEIEEYSPLACSSEQQNGVIIKPEEQQSKTKSKNLLRTKNVSSFNSTDGSFHDSPRSHESEATSYQGGENSASPSNAGALEEQRSVEVEDGRKLEQSRSEDYQTDEYRADAPARKHKNTDVSIMGRGYPPLKRIKRTSEVMFPITNQYLSPLPSLSTASLQTEPFPTMATLTQTNDTTSSSISNVNNYASAVLSSAARKYNAIAHQSSKDSHKYFPTQSHQNGYVTSHLSVNRESVNRENSSRQNSLRASFRDNSLNTSYDHSERMSDRYDPNRYPTNDRHNDRFLDVQERQMELFSEMLSRHEQFLLRLLEQQREAAEEAQKRDRDFMLKLIEMFVKKT